MLKSEGSIWFKQMDLLSGHSFEKTYFSVAGSKLLHPRHAGDSRMGCTCKPNSFRIGDSEAPNGIWINFALADTSVGRGFHSVGTAPGSYLSKLKLTIPLNSSK